MRKVLWIMLVFVFLLALTAYAQKEQTSFHDVPKGDYFEQYIYKLQELNITNGIGNGAFGFNKNISRAEFLTFLMRLQGLELDFTQNPDMFMDVKASDWFYPYINLGLKNNTVIKDEYADSSFQPNKPITREEMAVMIVRALKYDLLAASVNSQPSQFKDVVNRVGYVELAKDLGIINGRGKDVFDPSALATKQEAAAMLIRMHNLGQNKLDMVNGFYAIKSYEQSSKIQGFDSISYGWSRLDYNQTTKQIELTTTRKTGGQPFYIPEDLQYAVSEADKYSKSKYLMVFGSNEDYAPVDGKQERLVSLLLKNEAAVQKLTEDIVRNVVEISNGSTTAQFDGAVIDFEALRDNGVDKQSFTAFLTGLNAQLKAAGKKLIVCINPPRQGNQQYYNGYDLAAIGQLADYVILMAHDYEPKTLSSQEMQYFKGETPLAPIKDVYYAIKYSLNGGSGIPKEKLLLQLNLSMAQWQFNNGAAVNSKPLNPEYIKLLNRMKDAGTAVKSFNYSETYQAPYFVYEADGIRNIIWYEDTRSIAAKARLASMFGLKGLSVWRLGLIPDFAGADNEAYGLDIWSEIQALKK